jgi:phosphoglycerate dehydrogenase-like enzyme
MSFTVINTLYFERERADQHLAANGCEVKNVDLIHLSEDQMCAEVRGVAAIIAGNERYSERVFRVADNLKIVARAGAGYDQIDLEAAARHGIWVTTAPEVTKNSVADYTLAVILCQIRSIPPMFEDMKAGVWRPILGEELGSLTLGIIGTGHIGREVIRRAHGFGPRVLAFDIAPDEEFAAKYQFSYVTLDGLLSQSDIITLHCALNDETRGLINRQTLNRMKPHAYLINTSRPAVIVKEDLVEALSSKRLAGAVIDVHDPKPCPPGDPFITLDNVLATPWAAGCTHTHVISVAMQTAEEVVRVLHGGTPRFPLNRPIVRAKEEQ